MSQMNISGAASAPSTPSADSRSASSLSSPSQESCTSFAKAMQDDMPRHDMESGESSHQEESLQSEDDSSSVSTLFAGISNMQGQMTGLFSGRIDQMEALQSPFDSAELEQLVDRILVSTPESGGHEVRISLADGLLPGTEILLQRGLDGHLTVMLNTSDPSSFQTLVSAQDELKRILESHENGDVTVYVDQQGREEGDSRQRSRGYDEYFSEL